MAVNGLLTAAEQHIDISVHRRAFTPPYQRALDPSAEFFMLFPN